MDTRVSKRWGPLTWLAGSRRARWIVVLLVLVPPGYVVSSGPARLVLIRGIVVNADGVEVNPGHCDWKDFERWEIVYSPLMSLRLCGVWGDVLGWYWSHFPIPVDPPAGSFLGPASKTDWVL